MAAPVRPPDGYLVEARGWMEDCGMHAVGLTDSEVLDVLHREYCGGVEGFLRDQLPGGAR